MRNVTRKKTQCVPQKKIFKPIQLLIRVLSLPEETVIFILFYNFYEKQYFLNLWISLVFLTSSDSAAAQSVEAWTTLR